MQELRDRVAVVTGAASGIGHAMAERFAAEGMKVVLADIEEAGLASAEKALAAKGATTLGVVTDVSDAASVDALAKRCVDAFGAVHVVCNNAGVFAAGYCWEMPLDEFRWLMDVNQWGVVHGIRSFVPIMLEQDSEAHIVNTASMAGVTTLPYVAAYHMSKHSVLALSECLHHELAALGSKIKVSVLCPELINTQIHRAARNRPVRESSLEDTPSTARDLVMQAISAGVVEGLPPSEMADRVVRAIHDERFYILSEDEFWQRTCHSRLEDVRLGRNPAFTAPE
jgi:NAD(P)-dependent dehydrogenase (short-subunit alcohol dehydrogenase family)